ncbi:hypothetical protein [Leptolyngbya sp. FACHB-711]|uniref:hypothetical protein n=1 Tax=unclassified Leptolyngbya TaxID=2650499 RepID=UPI0016897E4F|nr:hypothetical protein [Leptolyngbya sp. FACHB-711]MBD1852076.1 hypothetical protein [Cyanobacteria bacterium FACHB-502]MBD2026564.1 hypothetical protein [Leptolyngbya sp. FACHB-711]
MTQYMNSSAFQPVLDSIAFSQEADLPPAETDLPPIPEAEREVAATSPATSREGRTNQPPLWQPVEPQFTKAIAEYYGVSRKSVQQWFQKVKEACPWFHESDLKLPDERYSPLCVELMGQYRTSGLPFEAWKTQLWEQNAELVAAYQAAQAQTQTAANPQVCAGITLRNSEVPLPVQGIQPLQLTVVDSTDRLTEAINSLNTTLQQFVSNDRTLEDALKLNATQKGSRLGTELAIAEIGSMVQATESARVELAKKLGLLSIPIDPPQQQSA